jgi:hypothetical protein
MKPVAIVAVALSFALAGSARADKVDWGPYIDHGGALPSNAPPRAKPEPKAKAAPAKPAKAAASRPAAKPRVKPRHK